MFLLRFHYILISCAEPIRTFVQYIGSIFDDLVGVGDYPSKTQYGGLDSRVEKIIDLKIHIQCGIKGLSKFV